MSNTVDYDPRQRAVESFGRTGRKLAGDALQVGVSSARAIQNSLFPNEFEYYALTLELVDSIGRTVDYLTFPVMPESLAYDDMKVANIQKTTGGITSIDNQSYTPKTISIQGTFGRRFKLLIQPRDVDTFKGAASRYDGKKGISIRKTEFDSKLKSGFGATKILQRIMSESSQLDEFNEPHRLYLYVPVLGDNFLVKCTQFQLSQEKQMSNMLWRYTVQLTAIAPLDAVIDEKTLKKSLQRNLTIDNLQKLGTKTTNTIVSSLRQLVGTTAGNQ